MPPPTGRLTAKNLRQLTPKDAEYQSDNGITPIGGSPYIQEFYDADPLLQGLQSGGFTRFKHGQRLARLFEDPDPKTALAASKEIRATIREAATISGAIGKTTATAQEKTHNGTLVRVVHRNFVVAPVPPPLDAPGITTVHPLLGPVGAEHAHPEDSAEGL